MGSSLGKSDKLYSAPPRLVGAVLAGRYSVGGIIGVGGNAVVYEARDTQLDRMVAIKVPTFPRDRKTAVKRFLREVRAASGIAHPNVCATLDFGSEHGIPFLVTERLFGETLADRLATQGMMDLPSGLGIVMQLLAGLSAAHARGVVHRDIKPGNVFLSRTSGKTVVVKVLDFGASTLDARLASDDGGFEVITGVGCAVGTPYYMAPEAIRGVRALDARVDVFAAGVILYEIVTGLRPFEGNDPRQLFAAILSSSPVPASQRVRGLPPKLDAVLARAITAAPEDRYPSAAAFASALEALNIEWLEPTRSTPVMWSEQAVRLGHVRQRFHELVLLHKKRSAEPRLQIPTSPDIPVLYTEGTNTISISTSDVIHEDEDDPEGTKPTKPRARRPVDKTATSPIPMPGRHVPHRR